MTRDEANKLNPFIDDTASTETLVRVRNGICAMQTLLTLQHEIGDSKSGLQGAFCVFETIISALEYEEANNNGR